MGNIFIWWPSYIIADNYWAVSILIKVMPCLYMSFIYLLTVRFNAKWEGFFSRNNCMETKVCLLQYILNADTLHFQRINTKKDIIVIHIYSKLSYTNRKPCPYEWHSFVSSLISKHPTMAYPWIISTRTRILPWNKRKA